MAVVRNDLSIRLGVCLAGAFAWWMAGPAVAQPPNYSAQNVDPAGAPYPAAGYSGPQLGSPAPGNQPTGYDPSGQQRLDPQGGPQIPPSSQYVAPSTTPLPNPIQPERPQPGAFVPSVGVPTVPQAGAALGVSPTPLRPGEMRVVYVQFEGLHAPNYLHLPRLETRKGEPYDPQLVEADVKKLMKTRKFIDVTPKIQTAPEGAIVIFMVVERPLLHYIKMIGNEGVLTSTLIKKTELETGQGMDPYSIKEARDKLEAYYQEHGWDRAHVSILEGNKKGDQGAVFMIDEGRAQRVRWTYFYGNKIATSGRLRTQIETKMPILYLFKGNLDRKKLDEDVEKLTAYYRSLGFFQARIGREMSFSKGQEWVAVSFYINEGPRYKVRNVSFIGNRTIANQFLEKDLKLHGEQFFNQSAMAHDLNSLRDLYGGQGYVFADIQADPRFLEEPAKMDLVYNVKEGGRYRVGKITVNIQGDSAHTHSRVVYDRLSLRPGDILDTRKLRSDERRLKASGLFASDPTKAPKMVFSPLPGTDGGEKSVAEKPGDRQRHGGRGSDEDPTYRGQSPDSDAVPDQYCELTITGTLADENPGATVQPASAAPASQPEAVVDPETGKPLSPADGPEFVPGASCNWQDPRQSLAARTFDQNTFDFSGPIAVRAQAPAVGPPVTGPYSNGGQPVQATGPDSNTIVQPYPNQQTYPGPPAYPTQQPQPVVPPLGSSVAPGYAAPVMQPAVYPNGQYPNSQYPNGQYPAAQYPNTYPNPTVQTAIAPTDVYSGRFVPGNAPTRRNTYYQNANPVGVAPPPNQLGVTPLNPVQVFDGPAPYAVVEPALPVDVLPYETQTGKLAVGVGVNSDAGLVGSVVVDEQNFDINRWPSSWDDFRNGQAFRGAGQHLRLEAAPGTQVQRYIISFGNPYLFDTPVSFSTSGSYYTRIFDDWTEARVGGRIGLGYYFTPDLSGSAGLRVENVRISNPTVPTPPELERVLGHDFLYGFNLGAGHDTRDNPFLPSQGHLLRVNYEQIFGKFQYAQTTLDGRQYYTLFERPDGSGRHVLGFGSLVGFSGSDTPIYDDFFAGGFSTLRGFAFRGASPRDMNVAVGGRFEFINTAEYIFPITADDVLKGVSFVDFGTVEPSVELKARDFRVAPGFGLRISVPALGPAPIALDFAFPIHHASGDRLEVFSFSVGVTR